MRESVRTPGGRSCAGKPTTARKSIASARRITAWVHAITPVPQAVRQLGTDALVLDGNPVDVVDHDSVHRRLALLQLQSELVLDCIEQINEICRAGGSPS